MPQITPTTGRVVQFYHTDLASLPHEFHQGVTPEEGRPYGPYAATVAWVWNDRCVNLGVHDAIGRVHPITNVRLLQEGDELPPENQQWAQWMPYQLGQAARTEQAEAASRG